MFLSHALCVLCVELQDFNSEQYYVLTIDHFNSGAAQRINQHTLQHTRGSLKFRSRQLIQIPLLTSQRQ